MNPSRNAAFSPIHAVPLLITYDVSAIYADKIQLQCSWTSSLKGYQGLLQKSRLSTQRLQSAGRTPQIQLHGLGFRRQELGPGPVVPCRCRRRSGSVVLCVKSPLGEMSP